MINRSSSQWWERLQLYSTLVSILLSRRKSTVCLAIVNCLIISSASDKPALTLISKGKYSTIIRVLWEQCKYHEVLFKVCPFGFLQFMYLSFRLSLEDVINYYRVKNTQSEVHGRWMHKQTLFFIHTRQCFMLWINQWRKWDEKVLFDLSKKITI